MTQYSASKGRDWFGISGIVHASTNISVQKTQVLELSTYMYKGAILKHKTKEANQDIGYLSIRLNQQF